MTSAIALPDRVLPIMAQITSSSARSRPKYSARGRNAGRMPLDWKLPLQLAVGAFALELEGEQVLGGDDVALHADHLGDVR